MQIELPRGWDQVTLRQYVGLFDLNSMDGSEDERVFATIALMADVDIDAVRKIRMKDLGRCIRHLRFLQQPIEGRVKKYIKMGSTRYRVTRKAETMKAGQYIDLNHFLTNEKAPKNFADIMAVLLEPTRLGLMVREKRPLEHQEIRDKVMELPVTVIKPIADFFLQKYGGSERDTVDYFLMKMKEQMENLEQMLSPKDMGGSE